MYKYLLFAAFLVLPFSASAATLTCAPGEIVQAEVSHTEYKYQKQLDVDPTPGRVWVASGSKTAWTTDTQVSGHAPDAVFKVGILDYRWHVTDTRTVIDSPEQCVPDTSYTPPASPVVIVKDSHARGHSFVACNEAHGKQWVTETSNGETYNACRPIAPVAGSTLSDCQMLTALATNGVSYCPGTQLEQSLWTKIHFAIVWLYTHK